MPVEFEDDLGDALRRTADTFRPADSRTLVSEGHLRGRRLRRRRTVTVVAGAAALAVVGVGGTLAAGHAGSGDRHPGSGVAAAPFRPVTTAAHTAAPVSGTRVAALFTSLLPHGRVTQPDGTGTDTGDPYVLASALFDNGHGKAKVEISVATVGAGIQGCPPPAKNPGVSCAITHVHGGTLMLFKGWEYPDHRGDLKDWTALFDTPDGSEIQFSQWNSAADKGAPVTQSNPPLNAAQMTSVVTSDKWRPVLAALPKPSKTGKGGTGQKGEPGGKTGAGTTGDGATK